MLNFVQNIGALPGGEGWGKTYVIFSRCYSSHHLPIFQLILLQFELNFQYYCTFLSIFDINNNFIIDFDQIVVSLERVELMEGLKYATEVKCGWVYFCYRLKQKFSFVTIKVG